MSDEKIMDDYIRECWNQDPDTWTQEEKAAVKKTIDFASYQLQKKDGWSNSSVDRKAGKILQGMESVVQIVQRQQHMKVSKQ